MDKLSMSIKKEVEEDEGATAPVPRGAGGNMPPTQRVNPTSTPLRGLVDSTMSLSPPGEIFGTQRTVFKLKRFLSTLIRFGTDISSSVGEKVKDMVFNLVAGKLSVGEFHRQLQDVTNFPVRPYVLPFLHTNIPFLQREVASLSVSAGGKTVLEYLSLHEAAIFAPPLDPTLVEASEIFHSEATESHSERKRRTSSTSESESAFKRHKPTTVNAGLVSPQNFPGSGSGPFQNGGGGGLVRKDMYAGKWGTYPGKLAVVPGCPSGGSGGENAATASNNSASPKADHGGNNDDEWKNVHVMLNCILGMVDKTQRAINILQQRQTSSSSFRATEEIIEEVQASAVRAVNEVKQNALAEIARARHELMLVRRPGKEKEGLLRVSTSQPGDSTTEICWNCGRPASETCSGCKVAKYCGAFCQHKDWENHHRVCRVSEEISIVQPLDLNIHKPDTSKEVK